jgi:hypothetical protein
MSSDAFSDQEKIVDYLHDLAMQMLRLSERPGLEMTTYLLGMVVLDLDERRSEARRSPSARQSG